MNRKVALIIGASAGVGRAISEKMAKDGYDIALVSSDKEDLLPICLDCSIKYGIKAKDFSFNLAEQDFNPKILLGNVLKDFGEINYLIYSAGYVSENDLGPSSDTFLDKTIRINYISPIKIISLLTSEIELYKIKSIVVLSSIAAFVPRKRNILYASSKAALEIFCIGIRHYLSDKQSIIQIYSLGYVDTSMSFGKKLFFPVISPSNVAEKIVSDINNDFGQRFYPGYWKWIVGILKIIPWFIYRKISF